MKNFVVIGGSSGIGEQLVNLLAQDGHRVFATFHTQSKENQTNVYYQSFDVLEDDLNIEDWPAEIHGLAYCPGSINLKPFNRFKEKDFIEDFKLQVLGATKIIQQLLPNFKRAGLASIVLFSTVAVQKGFPFHAQVAISKGAIEGLTKSLAAELAPNVRVNAIAPSLTQTNLARRLLSSPEKIEHHAKMNPLKKVGTAKEVAEAANFLLNEKSAWITGQIFAVDGGASTL